MNGEPLDIEPLPIQAKKEFTNRFDILHSDQKEVTKTFLYSSLQGCILDSQRRIFDGYPNRYNGIMAWEISIDFPTNLMHDELPEISDEQILLQVSSRYRVFHPGRFLAKANNSYFLELIEIYINSSRIDKIAILQFLQDLDTSESPTRPAQVHVALLLS